LPVRLYPLAWPIGWFWRPIEQIAASGQRLAAQAARLEQLVGELSV
jgi:hypothetical protein